MTRLQPKAAGDRSETTPLLAGERSASRPQLASDFKADAKKVVPFQPSSPTVERYTAAMQANAGRPQRSVPSYATHTPVFHGR
jgi:hypothetical protein